MQNIREHLHLIWADKIVLTLVVLALFFTALIWVFVALAAGILGANHVLASVGVEGALEGGLAAAALWAGLRALDYAFGGATFRLFRAEPTAVTTPAIPVGGNLLAH